MKNWIIFTALFTLNAHHTQACGYYPYGEDIRYSLLKPAYTSVQGWDAFHYTTQLYGYYAANNYSESAATDENTLWWQGMTGDKAKLEDIHLSLYTLSVMELHSSYSTNSFLRFLQKKENKELFDYLLFAKKCSDLNMPLTDPWERQELYDKTIRDKHIQNALHEAQKTKDQRIRRRYAYLAIRMAFYSGNYSGIDKIYQQYFAEKPKAKARTYDVTDYWALHFYCFTLKKSARKNVELARVFAHSSEKRYATQFQFDRKISLTKTLSAARNDDERASVYLIWCSRSRERCLNQMKHYYNSHPQHSDLDFLVLREVNKLEDWILTSYYAQFHPSLSGNSWEEDAKPIVQERIIRDRRYAAEVASWMKTVDKSMIRDQSLWNLMTDYLQFMAGNTAGLRQALHAHLGKCSSEDLARFGRQLEALVIAHDDHNLSSPLVQKALIDEEKKYNNRFLFSVGRELEFAGNTTEAAMVLSHLNRPNPEHDYAYVGDGYFGDASVWRSSKLYKTLWDDFFTDYFFYMDAQYTPQQVHGLIEAIAKSEDNSAFGKWKLSYIKKDVPRLYDLLGTKYIRKDKLAQAAWAFKQVDDTLWKSKYYPYHQYLDANPFYTDFYTEHRKSDGDTIRYNKFQITTQLMRYKRLAANTNGNKKAWYLMQVANCYFNMTHHGNSWMMRRYYWTSWEPETGLEDDSEFINCNKAKNCYVQANQASKNRAVKALMLRLAGRCESYRIYDAHSDDQYEDNFHRSMSHQNKYYNQLRKQYPDTAEELLSNCYSFNEYYRKMKRP